METLIGTVISALIGGGFTLIGIRYKHHLENQQITSPSAPSFAVTASVNIGAVIRDVGIIWLLTAAAGFIVGVATSPDEEATAAVAFGNIIFGTIGFVISGSRVHGDRWKHLFAVAIALWLSGIINIFLLGMGFGYWIVSLFLILLMMATGGGISYVFNRG